MEYLNKNKELIKFIFTVVFIIGLLSHGYFFLNGALSHDSLWAIDANNDLKLKIVNGRFMQYLVFNLRGWIVMPWILGVMSLFWTSCSVYIIAKTYNLDSKISIFFISLILILNIPNIITIATYVHEVDSYQLALFLSLLSVYVSRFKHGYILSIIFIVFTLGLYQPFISTIVTGFVLISIIDVLDNQEFKTIIKKGIQRILIIGAGCLLYLIVMNLIINLYEYKLSYRANAMFNIDFSIKNITRTMSQTINYFQYAPSHTILAVQTIFFCYKLFFIILVYNLIISIINNKLKKSNILLSIILLIVFIFSMNIMYFISNSEYHNLMHYGNLFMIFLGIILADYTSKIGAKIGIIKINRGFRLFSFILILVIYFNNFVFANQSYFRKYTDFISVNSTMTRIIKDMEDIEGYVIGETQVLFSDPLSLSALYNSNDDMPQISPHWMLKRGIISIRASYEQYFKNIMKYPINLHEINYQNYIANERILFPEFLDMPQFPNNGYMQMVDGVILIKIGN